VTGGGDTVTAPSFVRDRPSYVDSGGLVAEIVRLGLDRQSAN